MSQSRSSRTPPSTWHRVWPRARVRGGDALASAAVGRLRTRGSTRRDRTQTRTWPQSALYTGRQLNRRTRQELRGRHREKVGVRPSSILTTGVVGDGRWLSGALPGGAKSTSSARPVRTHRGIPLIIATGRERHKRRAARGKPQERRKRRCCFARLATLRSDLPLFGNIDELAGRGRRRTISRRLRPASMRQAEGTRTISSQ